MIELDAQTAEYMGALILQGSQGTAMLIYQRPLTAIDLVDAWLVRGQPYEDKDLELKSCMFHVIFDKKTANILSIGLDGCFLGLAKQSILVEMLEKHVIQDRQNTDNYFDLSYAMHGGLINSPSAAVEYARQITRCRRQSNTNSGDHAYFQDPQLSLQAEEINDVWYIKETLTNKDVLAFSRVTCQLSEVK